MSRQPDAHSEHDAGLSVWPMTLALGITLLAFGFVTSTAFSVVGAATILIATGGWIQELRHE